MSAPVDALALLAQQVERHAAEAAQAYQGAHDLIEALGPIWGMTLRESAPGAHDAGVLCWDPPKSCYGRGLLTIACVGEQRRKDIVRVTVAAGIGKDQPARYLVGGSSAHAWRDLASATWQILATLAPRIDPAELAKRLAAQTEVTP